MLKLLEILKIHACQLGKAIEKWQRIVLISGFAGRSTDNSGGEQLTVSFSSMRAGLKSYSSYRAIAVHTHVTPSKKGKEA